jgi:hypothetical protein
MGVKKIIDNLYSSAHKVFTEKLKEGSPDMQNLAEPDF